MNMGGLFFCCHSSVEQSLCIYNRLELLVDLDNVLFLSAELIKHNICNPKLLNLCYWVGFLTGKPIEHITITCNVLFR